VPRHPTLRYKDFLQKFAVNIKRERNAAGLTQEELAELAELHPRMIQKIEAAECNVLFTTVTRLQAALGCAWSQLAPPVERKRLPRQRARSTNRGRP
jgi:transcriptional regulator with XRE-family HTH domain